MPDDRPTNPEPSVAAAVERVLTGFLSEVAGSLPALDPALAPFAAAAREAVLDGGKRLRPTFAYWGWRGVVGPEPPIEPVLPALAALELLHAFALVQDDVMDGSATRRGRPATHLRLATGRPGRQQWFGRSAAILVSDLCLVWADQLMSRSEVSPPALVAARHRYDLMRTEAIAGQYLDLLGAASTGWSVRAALRTAQLKTASYTVVRPLQLGAALGLSPDRPQLPRQIATAYARYGRPVGEAFQLRDDLLGGYGQPAATGKPAGEDLAARRPTVLLELARQRATGGQRAELDRLLDPDRPGDPDRLAVLVRATGAADQVERMIQQRVSAAQQVAQLAPIHPLAAEALAKLAATAAWRVV